MSIHDMMGYALYPIYALFAFFSLRAAISDWRTRTVASSDIRYAKLLSILGFVCVSVAVLLIDTAAWPMLAINGGLYLLVRVTCAILLRRGGSLSRGDKEFLPLPVLAMGYSGYTIMMVMITVMLVTAVASKMLRRDIFREGYPAVAFVGGGGAIVLIGVIMSAAAEQLR